MQNRIFAVLAAVLVIAGWWFLLYAPMSSAVQEADEEVEQLEERADTLRAEVADLAGLVAQEDEFRTQLAAQRELLPVWDVERSEVDPTTLDTSVIEGPRLGRQLEQLAAAFPVELTTVAFAQPQPEPQLFEDGYEALARVQTTVQVRSASVDGLRQFLSATMDRERMPRGLVWRSVSIAAQPEADQQTGELREVFTLNGAVSAWAHLVEGEAPEQEEEQPDDELLEDVAS